MTMFTFGSNHITYDPEIHEATWGARLIYSEVAAGGGGIVWDRQTPDGDPEKVRLLFPVLDRATEEFRKVKYELDSGQDGHLLWRDGRVLVVLAPQGSYGYLYARAVLEKEGHENETKFWEFEDQPQRKEFGNWPPRIVEKAQARERKSAVSEVSRALWDWRMADIQIRGAKTDRARTLRQNKADRLSDEVADLVRKHGLNEDEIATARKEAGIYA